MSDKNVEELDTLEPIKDEQRPMSLWSYIPVWWSAMIVVMVFAVGFFAVNPNGPLNLNQAIVSLALASVVIAVLFVLNAFPGYLHGVPFAAQVRSSFGTKGANIATIARSIPAIFWLGIATWAGGVAINTITQTLWGFGNSWVYFVLFLILNVILALGGAQVMKIFNSIAGWVLVGLMTITLITTLRSGALAAYKAVPFEGSWWGYGFWSVFSAGGACIITGALNVSDMSRLQVKSKGSLNNWLGHMLGIVPAYFYMLFLGIIYGMATGTPDPIGAMVKLSPTLAMGIAMLVFVLGAQISSNLTLNILASAHGVQNISPKLSWKTGVLISAVACLFTFPWILFTSAHYYTFMNAYSCFLGPILGITLADYWIVSRKQVDVKALYDMQKGAKYWYKSGFSIAAIISLIVGGVLSLFAINFSWLIGLPVGFVLYIVLKAVGVDRVRESIPSK
jgi:NCS1 family nucleobase:cation symporter-1